MPDFKQKERLAKIATPLGDDVLVLKSFTALEELGRLFEFTAIMSSDQPDIQAMEIVGQPVSVELNLDDDGSQTRFFHGLVSRFVKTNRNRIPEYTATIVPWLWMLKQHADCRIFQNIAVPDIIQQVFKDLGFSDFELRLSGEHSVWEYCVQYRETDFNFVSRLMEQEGIYYFFSHEKEKHTLVICDSVSAHRPAEHYETVSWRPAGTHGVSDQHIREWSAEVYHKPGQYVHTDYDFKKPKSDLQAVSQIPQAYALPDLEIFDYPGEYEKPGDGEAWARIRMEELDAPVVTRSGWGDARGLSVGSTFKLTEFFDESSSGNFLIAITRTTFHTGVYATGESSGDAVFRCDLSVIPADKQFRAVRATPKPLINGIQTAAVTGPSGEEIHTDEYGRIKVLFHWDRAGKADDTSSCWIRVAQVWAGKNWGAITLPRVGQEVVVAFLEGDPDQPLVIGSVYNGVQMPPYALPAEKTKSTLKSNSSKGSQGFNEIRMEDKKGSEQLFIHAERNQDIRVKADRFETIGHNRHLVVENDKFEHIKNNRDELVDATHKEKIVADRNLTVGGKQAIAIDGSNSVTVKGDMIEVFKSNHSETTTGDVYIKGANIVIEAGTNITLKVGGSWIAIEADGVKMSGPTVTMEGSTAAEVMGATVTIKGGTVAIN